MLRTFLAVCLGLLLFMGQALAGVDVNSASASELQTLPGIGPSKATAIIEYRTANGPFASVDALDAVPGIGPATLDNIRAFVSLSGGTSAAAPAAGAAEPSEPAPQAAAAAPAASGSGGININTASATELQQLPGIGPSKAAAIIEFRTANGLFASCSALQNVTGIGPATVAQVEPACTVQ